MKSSILFLLVSFFTIFLISCGSNTDLALGTGSGNEGEARTVCGIIVTETHSGAGNIGVRLLPADYNPAAGDTITPPLKKAGPQSGYSAQKKWDSLKATTDQHGYFEIKHVPFNTYNLVSDADDSLTQKLFAKVVVDSSESPFINLDTIHEKQPGRIQLTILDSVATLNISLVLLGTGIRVPVTHAGTYTIAAPAGTLKLVCMRFNNVSGVFEPAFQYDDIVVLENRTTLLGGSSNTESAKRAIN